MVHPKQLALKKATSLVGHEIQLCTNARQLVDKRGYTTSAGPQVVKNENGRLRKKPRNSEIIHKDDRKRKTVANRDFLKSILESHATTREARSYLKAFAPPSVSQSPNFSQTKSNDQIEEVDDTSIHIALVKVIAPQTFDDDIIQGVGQTLFQLEQLGLLSIVVLDCNGPGTNAYGWRQTCVQQTARMVSAIDKYVKDGGRGARTVDSVVGIEDISSAHIGRKHPRAHIILRKLLMAPLRKGIIPVLPSWGFPTLGQRASPIDADAIVLALTRELAGLHPRIDPDEDPKLRAQHIKSIREEASIDRLIILDPKGGIPTSTRSNRYHVFINLEQEFEEIKQELLGTRNQYSTYSTYTNYPHEQVQSHIARLEDSNPFSRFAATELNLNKPIHTKEIVSPAGETAFATNDSHVKNLELVHRVLGLLPPNASALLTTPEEAANKHKPHPFQGPGVGTRPLRNPLIHNLLTDKPAFSSSLPASRIGLHPDSTPSNPAITFTPTTFAKRGMPLTIFPDPRKNHWEPPSPTHPSLNLQSDSRIDFPRLVHLINDSFNRNLDVPAYLARIQNRVAGVIIAGEYEGGALLTWELPPGVPDDGSPESRARMVPYLDKFAVLKKAQGTGGVADIVFSAMVGDCFPNGVVWRSRKDNPVNKWYFERARGTRRLEDSNWTMFWTGEGDVGERIKDFEAVCRAVEPTWMDGKKIE